MLMNQSASARPTEPSTLSADDCRLLLASLADRALLVLDREGRVTTWNGGAERITRYDARGLLGRPISAFYTPEDRASGRPEMELALVRDRKRIEDEGWRLRGDGTRFWACTVLAALSNADGSLRGYGIVMSDLTERHEEAQAAARQASVAAKNAEEAAQRAEAASRIKDEFLATVSHELRTPLNAIVGWSSILKERSREPSIVKGISVIHRNAEAQKRIIEDILDMSRVITGKLRLELKPTDLAQIAREAIEVVRPSASAKLIAVELLTDPELPVVVADPGRLQQVVWNLLSNSVKFTEAGGAITTRLQQEGSKLVVAVTDTGCGIEQEFLPYVFDRFKQGDGSTTRRVGGLGLGLAIVRHIVELHGGHVEATSAGRGHGATFRVVLPIRATTSITEAPKVPSSAPPMMQDRPEGASLGGIRALLVDDEPDARELLEMVLAEAGASVETAGSAEEGFESLRRFRPHVLVSDIGMPDEDGYSFMQRVRADTQHGRSLPAIALTAYTRHEDKVKALAAGFTTHIGKPVNPDDLVSLVAKLGSPRALGDHREPVPRDTQSRGLRDGAGGAHLDMMLVMERDVEDRKPES
jgi:PAS domain S-box-containing protein